MVFSFCRLAISALLFWVVFNHFQICKISCSSKYHRSYIDENIIITKLQKLYSPVRNLSVGNKSPMLLLKKCLCKGDLSPAHKMFIKSPAISFFAGFKTRFWIV